MLQSEFETLTDIYADSILYEAIEEAYNNSDYADKDGFCHDYKFNVGGLAQRIQKTAEQNRWTQEEQYRTALMKDTEIIHELSKKLDEATSGTGSMKREDILDYALYGAQCSLLDYCDFVKTLDACGIDTVTADKLIEFSTHVKELKKELERSQT